MLQYKKIIYIYFTIILFSLIILCSSFYIYDPLQIFHKPWARVTTFHSNMRLQTAGITNNYTFDSIILGTSMLENTSSNEAKALLDGNFINLSLSGSTYYERLIIMKHIFKQHNIDKVLYSLDAGSYIHRQKAYASYPLETFDYLYDSNRFNDFRAYFNTKFIKCLITFSQEDKCIGKQTTLDRPNAWFKEKGNITRYGGLENWFKAENNLKIRSALQDIVFNTQQISKGKKISLKDIDNEIIKSKHYIDETIISFVKQHPETTFILVFPPYSRMHYAWWAQYYLPYFEIHKTIIKHITEKSDTLKNLKVYGFEDQLFLDDLANYKDAKHYHYSINAWILSQISKNENLLTKENLPLYIDTITKKALNYDIVNIGKKIDKYLKNTAN